MAPEGLACFAPLVAALVLCVCHPGEARLNHTLLEKLKGDTDLSQIYYMADKNRFATVKLDYGSVTLFAPLNKAFQKYSEKQEKDNSLVLYHLSNSAQTLSQLQHSISSEFDGNPPLWVTKVKTGNTEQIYINNAKVITEKSDKILTSKEGKKQVLHVLDEVLQPIHITNSDFQAINLNAYQLLKSSENLDLGNYTVRLFRKRVDVNNKQDVFTADGKFTFFIPVDDVFKPPPRPEKIDQKVIDGHVIPGKILFTAPTPTGVDYETLAFTDMLKVTINFAPQKETEERRYVTSHTKVGDSNHEAGVIMAEILKANIPVQNGVVHLIHRPLMVADTTVTQFLESFKALEDGPLRKFYETIRDVGGDYMDRLTNTKELTLFAPANAAWKDPRLNDILMDKNKIREILNMHLVEQKLPVEEIVYRNLKEVPSAAPNRKLYFNVINDGGNKTLTVEGSGVNATVIQADIVNTNGIVHIIDRVLGVAVDTIAEKLRTDPMLKKTFFLANSTNFIKQLESLEKKLTFFVPRDLAWQNLETISPSAHKKLFMKKFVYQAHQILERHLIQGDRVYTIEMLKNMTQTEPVQLPSVRDVFKIKMKENNYMEWNNEKIHIFRQDVACTNGMIHVIDRVLVRESDIYVTGSGEVVQPLHGTLGFIICLIISQYL